MKKLGYLIPCLLMTFFSCSQEEGATQTEDISKPMTVRTEIAGTSRAMITDTRFPDGSTLGITLVENKDGVLSYDGLTDGYYNIQYKAKGTYPDQVWTADDKPIYLSSTDGRAVAYYPYNEEEGDDYTSLPLAASGQTDYMYSKWVSPINNLKSEALFTMQHAMTGIKVSIIKGSYTGKGKVSEIRLTSTALGITGTLDASTGSISDVTIGEINTYMMQPVFQSFDVISDDYTSVLLMGVPNPGVRDDVTISVKVDDRLYQVIGTMVQAFTSGYLYTFKLILDNTALSVSGDVEITPWQEDNTASTENGGVMKPVVSEP